MAEPEPNLPGLPPRVRVRHMAKGIREDGAVSALCFRSPRAIDMRRSSWVMRAEAVTCPKCLKALRNAVDAPPPHRSHAHA